MDLIELKEITFAYSEAEMPVLDHFSFSLAKGKCLMVEGENGAGKTTLFRILNGLSFPQRGEYFFDGTKIDRDYLKNNQNAKVFHKRIGYLFQNPDLMLFNASVYDEIAFGPRQMGLTESEVKTRTEDCMNLFHLSALKDKAPYHLSGGQKKRVALAAVMALNPEVLILDESFAGLDQKNAENLMVFLKEMKSAGKTLIIASHHSSIKDNLVDDVLILVSHNDPE